MTALADLYRKAAEARAERHAIDCALAAIRERGGYVSEELSEIAQNAMVRMHLAERAIRRALEHAPPPRPTPVRDDLAGLAEWEAFKSEVESGETR